MKFIFVYFIMSTVWSVKTTAVVKLKITLIHLNLDTYQFLNLKITMHKY